MSEALVPPPRPAGRRSSVPARAAVALPAVIVDAGPAAVERFLEFFAAAIANGRTRVANGTGGGAVPWRGAASEVSGCGRSRRTHPGSGPTVKQHLAATGRFCDWFVVHQVLLVNRWRRSGTRSTSSPKGATPVPTPAETRALLDRIEGERRRRGVSRR